MLKIQKSNKINVIAAILLAMISAVASIFDNMTVIGICIIVTNAMLFINIKGDPLLKILISIISFINCSVGFYNCILDGIYAPLWQLNGMLASDYNYLASKSIVIFSIVLLVILSIFLKRKDHIEIKRVNCSIIAIPMIVILLIIFVFAIFEFLTHVSSGYFSVRNPIFEYASILIGLLWLYSDNKYIDVFIKIYCVIYSILFLLIGDRSCAVTIVVLLYLLYYSKKINGKKIVFLFLLSVFTLNMIGLLRSNPMISFLDLIVNLLDRGLYVDTITWSYYTSVTIAALNDYVEDSWRFIFGNVLYYITGIATQYSGMSNFARDNFTNLYNMGGGIYPSYFYGMLGFKGVILGSIILGFIIVSIFNSKSSYAGIYRLLLVSLSFRWYLYSISTLFRGILVLATVMLFLCEFIRNLSFRRLNN